MATITSRTALKDYCLRQLGDPVIEINVDDDQIDERIDDALNMFRQFHFDGQEKVFIVHTVTSTDVTNEYIDMVDPVEDVVRVLPLNSNNLSGDIFNEEYQFRLSDMETFKGTGLINYYLNRSHWNLISDLLGRYKTIHFTKVQNRLFIEADWVNDIIAGTIIVVEAYKALNPDTYTEIYNDTWLKKYSTQLIKQQWGANLKKFEGTTLPGGISLNGQQLFDEATTEIEKLEEQLHNDWMLPPEDQIG